MGLFQGLTDVESRQATGGGAGWLIDAGYYVCEIQGVELGTTREGKVKLAVSWDVAEGPFAGTNAGSMYPPVESLVMEGKGLPYSKYKLECISKSNPGFDAVAAADAGAWDAFTGKVVGLGIGVEHYTKGPRSSHAGEDGERNYVYEWVDVPSLRAGAVSDGNGGSRPLGLPPERDTRKKRQPATDGQIAAARSQVAQAASRYPTASATDYGDEIPF